MTAVSVGKYKIPKTLLLFVNCIIRLGSFGLRLNHVLLEFCTFSLDQIVQLVFYVEILTFLILRVRRWAVITASPLQLGDKRAWWVPNRMVTFPGNRYPPRPWSGLLPTCSLKGTQPEFSG